MDRTELIQQRQEAIERLKVLAPYDDGETPETLSAELAVWNKMDDAALRKAFFAAAKADDDLSRIKRTRQRLADLYQERRLHLVEVEQQATTKLLGKAMPAILADAIKRLEAEVEFRNGLNISTVYQSPYVHEGNLGLTRNKRTAADERASARAVKALSRVRALALVDCDLQEELDAIFDELAAGDKADRWSKPEPKPELAAVGAAGDSNEIILE